MALVTAAALAGTAAAAMYLDGKYHVKKDAVLIYKAKRAEALYQIAVLEKRQSLYYLFERHVQPLADVECVWSREGCYTWKETYDRANQYGQWFLSHGVKPNDMVAFYLYNSPDFIFAWLGLWAVGASPAMINYNLAGDGLVHCMKTCGAKLLLVDDDAAFRARIDGVAAVLEGELGMTTAVMDEKTKAEIYSLPPTRPDDSCREDVQGDWSIAMFYTSGTTGKPKGVPFTVARGYERGVGYNITVPGDRWYNCMPMYHGTGGMTAVTQLITGITVCVGKKFSTSNFWRECADSRATWMTYVGETARYLLAAPPSPFDRAHVVRGMHGNGLRPDVWVRFRERFGISEILEFFNSSEGVFGLSVLAKGDYYVGSVGHHGVLLRRLYQKVFVPVKIDEETGKIIRDPHTGFATRLPYEVGGEMIVAVPNEAAFAGYFNNPSATSAKFERDVFRKGDLYYRSGDALRRTADGRWFFLDRLGDTFRWKGENVSTADVAEVLGKFPGVVEANVYGVLLPKHDGRAGCAAVYIPPSERSTFDYTGLLKHARTHLPRYAVPIFIRVVAEMTPIHNNKQNKVPLRAEGVDPDRVKAGDEMLWIREQGGQETYVPFTRDAWEGLQGGISRL